MPFSTFSSPAQLPPSLASRSPAPEPKLHLLTVGTPNGKKVTILLEELIAAYPGAEELAYDFVPISFAKNEQKNAEFLAVNPNGRIPALVDESVQVNGGKGHNVWESASILLWLSEKYDKEFKFSFEDPVLKSQAMSWIFFAHGGVGPMQGQANHFFRYAPEKIPYGIKRYQEETTRLYSVLEDGLKAGKGEYLVGDKFSIADINVYPWVAIHDWSGVSTDEFPLVTAWLERIKARPGVQAGSSIPEPEKKLTKEEEEEKAQATRDAFFSTKK